MLIYFTHDRFFADSQFLRREQNFVERLDFFFSSIASENVLAFGLVYDFGCLANFRNLLAFNLFLVSISPIKILLIKKKIGLFSDRTKFIYLFIFL